MTVDVGGLQDPPAEAVAQAVTAFGLLSSRSRLHIMWALSQGESDVTGLAGRVDMALPAVSQHLAKLKLAGLVAARPEGRRQVYYIDDPDIAATIGAMVALLAARAEQRSLQPLSPLESAPGRPDHKSA
ncbi:helix-turn-helix transcriptional regulator [Streptomyces sp. TP-A0356]|uniref:ArsR/SmtB family transcription factor n=1 Tax=Streptomyces sp. TP-A0356 TaxID=1359208 RepID=UPI0006E15176|nr:metalloregulator ArsR/SmtB family transcription factor [Streptomyces sp. TP-A0356]